MSLISILVPVFNEEESLPKLYEQVVANFPKGYDREIWFVNDGSTDNSVNVIKELHEKDESIHLISFRKNFGKATALQAGFRNVNGDIVITMDADLQDDPIELTKFVDKINEGYDVVSGWKKERHDPLEKRLPSKLFNKVTSKLSGVKLHDFNCGYKAYRREVVDAIDIYGEMHRYIPCLAYRKGFRIAELVVHHNKREFGKSKYGFERYLRGLFDAITVAFLGKYYERPMHLFGKGGLLCFGAGFIISLYMTILWFMGNAIGHRPLLQLGILLLIMGAQLFSIGLIGDMLVDATIHNRYNECHIKEKF